MDKGVVPAGSWCAPYPTGADEKIADLEGARTKNGQSVRAKNG
jgi:hypothetical protein